MTGPTRRLLDLIAGGRWWIALAGLLGFATVGSGIGLMATAAYLVSLAALRPSIAELQVAIVGVRFFGLSRAGFRYLERYLSHQVTFRLLARLRVLFFRALEPLAPARLIEHRTGDLLARIVSDVDTLEHFYVRVLGPSLVATLTAGLAFGLLAGHGLTLAAVVCLVLGAAALGGWALSRLLRAPGRRVPALRADLQATLVDGVQGLGEIVALGQGERHRCQVEALSRALEREQGGLTRRGALGAVLTAVAGDLAVVAALGVAIPLVLGGEIAGVQLAVIALVTLAAFEVVGPLPLAFQQMEASLAAAGRLFEIVDTPPAIQEPKAAVPVPGQGPLAVRGVCFTYPGESRAALHEVDLDLPAGGRVALVGPSGAGKSTLAHLLLRFWDYRSGSIRLGDHELRAYASSELRARFAVVSQRPYLFGGSIRQNLMLARPDAREEEMIEAAERAGAHAFVTALPEGYDTWIGEQGVRLSGGQRQRLAITRALLQDAPCLLLDEPTAHLDPATERDVLGELLSRRPERSVLIITHRLAELHRVDEIVVLSEGWVVERGTHAELVGRGGLYRRMHDRQQGIAAVRSALAHGPEEPQVGEDRPLSHTR